MKQAHNIAWDDSRIITTNNRYGQRLCLEAWHINVIPCALIGMTEVIYHNNIYILLVDDVTMTVYKVMSFNHQTTPDEHTRPECRNVGS